jgi:O-antigen/teichoic acid export membrane protein
VGDGAAPAAPRAPAGSLLANFSWVLAGRIAYIASQWALLVILARWGSAEVVGEFGLALALTSPAFMLAQMGLRDLYTTERDAATFPVYLALRLVSVLAGLVVVGAIVAVTGYAAPLAAAVLLVGLAKAVESISDMLFGTMQREERMEFIGRSYVYRGLLAVASVAAVMYLFRSLAAASLALAASWTVILFAYDLPNARRVSAAPGALRPRWDLQGIRGLGWAALPLGGVAMLGALQTNTGRYLLELFSDRAALGYFTAVAATVASLDIIIVAMNKTALSRLGAAYRADVGDFERQLWRMSLASVGVGVAALGFGALFGRALLGLAYGAAYGAFVPVLVWLLVGRVAVCVYTFVKAAQVVMRQLNAQFAVSLVSSAAGFGVGVLVVPRWGIVGAAMSVAATQWIALLVGSGGLALSLARTRGGGGRGSAASDAPAAVFASADAS